MISAQPVSDGWILFLPLCPSTNARMQPVRMGRNCRAILTTEAREYIWTVGFELKTLMRQEKFKPIAAYVYVDLWFILPRTNCDAHNYGKILFDAMQYGGVVTNDKFILPRIMGVWHEGKGEAVVKLPLEREAVRTTAIYPIEA